MNFLDEIIRLCGEAKPRLLRRNSNEYRILIEEPDGLTAYYASCPVYRRDGGLVERNFVREDGRTVFHGAAALVEVEGERLVLGNLQGRAELTFAGDVSLEPTYNGVCVRAAGSACALTVRTERSFYTKENGSYFALMEDGMTPFLMVAGMFGRRGNKLSPLRIEQREQEKNYFSLQVRAEEGAEEVVFECNLYVPKLLFDTTVESGCPERNNVYGTMAFLGETEAYGEQWLYSRADAPRLLDLSGLRLKKALLHLRRYSTGAARVDSYRLDSPWCSFGSTWNAKAAPSRLLHRLRMSQTYLTADVTDSIQELFRGGDRRNPGVVLCGKGEAAVVATGDHCLHPQILECSFQYGGVQSWE